MFTALMALALLGIVVLSKMNYSYAMEAMEAESKAVAAAARNS